MSVIVFSKMAHDVLKCCKKYIIQRIVDPSVYWVTEYEAKENFTKEVKRFESLLEKDVVKFNDKCKIRIGSMVAVKDETGFHRGLVTDTFNRDAKVKYCILLVDHGKVIETCIKKIYFIKSKELKLKKSDTVEVSIQNIYPVSLVLGCEPNFLSSIFQKRECNKWSSAAFKFVKNLLEKNPFIFVKPFKSERSKISGEIYFIQESDEMPVSLGQKLCDEGFAVIRYAAPKLTIRDHLQGISDIDIEEKIPENALLREILKFKELEVINQSKGVGTNKNDTCNLADSTGKTNNLQGSHYKECEIQSDSYNLLSSKIVLENKSFKSKINTSIKSSENSYNSSWMLKKCQNNNLTSSPSGNLFKEQNICETENGNMNSPDSPKVNLFRIVQRNMKYFNEQKEKAAGLGHN